MDSCCDTFGNLIRYFAFRRYLIDLKSFRCLLGFEIVVKQSKSITESQGCTDIRLFRKEVLSKDFSLYFVVLGSYRAYLPSRMASGESE